MTALQSQFILSPCGTNVLSNDISPELRSLIFQYANATSPEAVPKDDRACITEHIAARRGALLAADIPTTAKLSAELNALTKCYGDEVRPIPGQRPDIHCLLCTDTWLGKEAALLVEAWLKARGFTVFVKDDIRDLRTDSLSGFQTAMADLTLWCAQELPGYRQNGYRILFNLTGGFKSIQGFLQTLAMFYADESFYIFETSPELLRLPRLPIRLDLEQHVRDHLAIFRNLFLHRQLPTVECSGIVETLLLTLDDNSTLSAWGQLVWNETSKNLYQTNIFPPPIAQIEFGSKFLTSTRDLSGERKAIINERIDDLARYLLSNRQQPISRLDFKALEGNPRPPATHEIDAWADGSAKRIFCQDNNGRIVLLELASKL